VLPPPEVGVVLRVATERCVVERVLQAGTGHQPLMLDQASPRRSGVRWVMHLRADTMRHSRQWQLLMGYVCVYAWVQMS